MRLHISDRFLRGATAGFIAGLAMNLINFTLVRFLFFGEDLLIDYAGEMLYGNAPGIAFEYILSFGAHIIWTMFLGIVFSYSILIIQSKYILFKGWFYSVIIWFLLYSVGILFEVPLLKINSPSTVTSHVITATVYGLVLAYVYERLTVKSIYTE